MLTKDSSTKKIKSGLAHVLFIEYDSFLNLRTYKLTTVKAALSTGINAARRENVVVIGTEKEKLCSNTLG